MYTGTYRCIQVSQCGSHVLHWLLIYIRGSSRGQTDARRPWLRRSIEVNLLETEVIGEVMVPIIMFDKGLSEQLITVMV